MDNTSRRVRYLTANRPDLEPEAAALAVRSAYVHGTLDVNLGLTPAQCRRIRHKRGHDAGPNTVQARRAAVRARRAARWDVLTPRPAKARPAPEADAGPRTQDGAQGATRLHRAAERRASRAARAMALVRRKAG